VRDQWITVFVDDGVDEAVLTAAGVGFKRGF
jgi:hypothetical protein